MQSMTAAVIASAGLTFALAGGAIAKAKCETTKASAVGASRQIAKEVALQTLTEAIRDSDMKARGKISYTCGNAGLIRCTAMQRACR